MNQSNKIIYILHTISIILLVILLISTPKQDSDFVEVSPRNKKLASVTTKQERVSTTTVAENTSSLAGESCDVYTGLAMRGETLVQEIFNKKNLRNADFRDTTLASLKFIGSNMQCISFDNATLARPEFIASDLRKATFIGATITEPTFSNSVCPDGTNSDANNGTCILKVK